MSDMRGHYCDQCGRPAMYSTLIGCERLYCCYNPDCVARHDNECREGEEMIRENEYWDGKEKDCGWW